LSRPDKEVWAGWHRLDHVVVGGVERQRVAAVGDHDLELGIGEKAVDARSALAVDIARSASMTGATISTTRTARCPDAGRA